jgi:ADP-ribose pyrophosphatase YjhB (NUDIX family)
MQAALDKVTAFVTRSNPHGLLLLLFEHPYAGVQIPAGTVEPGEAPEAAARREVGEETGLVDLRLMAYIGAQNKKLPADSLVVLETTPVYARPDAASFDWARLQRGILVRIERRQGDFIQVTYEEGNKYPNPYYITYQITGWVPRWTVTSTMHRHFYHFIYEGTVTAASWEIYADKHNFRPFWAPLAELDEIPTPIITPQRAWLDFINVQLGYAFEEIS